MTQIATDPSQSARLIACGIDPKSADFVWMDDNPPRLTLRTEIIEDNNPYIVAFAWSLSALLALLPVSIYCDYNCSLQLARVYDIGSQSPNLWEVRWMKDYIVNPFIRVGNHQRFYDVSLIESCVRAIE